MARLEVGLVICSALAIGRRTTPSAECYCRCQPCSCQPFASPRMSHEYQHIIVARNGEPHVNEPCNAYPLSRTQRIPRYRYRLAGTPLERAAARRYVLLVPQEPPRVMRPSLTVRLAQS